MSEAPTALFPVAAVSRRTGLSPDVLRVWERRYRAVEPHRSAGGHRLYSEADVERLRLLAIVTASGFPIRQVARMPISALRELTAQPGRLPQNTPGDQAVVARCLAATLEFDAARLVRELERASLERGVLALVTGVLSPLLEEIGAAWQRGELDPSQEHLATTAVRSFLTRAAAGRLDGPTLVVATPAGQRHELGALLASVVASIEGWRSVYLGPDLPAAALALAAEQLGARAVALSVTCVEPWPEAELRRLRELLPGVGLLVGGRVAPGLRGLSEQLGIQLLGHLDELRAALAALAPATEASLAPPPLGAVRPAASSGAAR
jgi:DNA-binding transcriptional MerR regulator